jgi:glycerophosphoryl diester phosphodiesterase
VTPAPSWLTAQPIAHRGLHDRPRGIIENSPSAASAAIDHGFAIECDVQITEDGEAVVFHDFTLDRLTSSSGRVDATPARVVTAQVLTGGGDRIPTLQDFCGMVAGRVPIVCEIKSRFDGDMRLAERVAAVVADYAGPFCIESFDPRVMAHLRERWDQLQNPKIPLGIVAQANFDNPADEWAHLPPDERRALAQFLHYTETRPDFLSFGIRDLPHAVPYLCRVGLSLPVTVWTIRNEEERARARTWGDQIVFEGSPDFARG